WTTLGQGSARNATGRATGAVAHPNRMTCDTIGANACSGKEVDRRSAVLKLRDVPVATAIPAAVRQRCSPRARPSTRPGGGSADRYELCDDRSVIGRDGLGDDVDGAYAPRAGGREEDEVDLATGGLGRERVPATGR